MRSETIYLKRELNQPYSGYSKTIYRIDDKGWYQIYPKTTYMTTYMATPRSWYIVCNRADCIDNHDGWDVLTKAEAFIEMI